MPNHTKRSPAFTEHIQSLVKQLDTLRDAAPGLAGFLDSVIEVLQKNTTDSRCVVKAKDDEPIFVLRGQDRLSAGLVLAWAQLYDDARAEAIKVPELAYNGTPRSNDACECSEDMARYHTRKFPD